MRHVFATWVAAAFLAGCCPDEPEPDPGEPATWTLEVEDHDGAYLAIAPLDDVGLDIIAVGGRLIDDDPPAILRRKDGAWAPLAGPPGWRGAIWWAWTAGPGDVWLVGEHMQVARGAPGSWSLVETASVAGSESVRLYGVWGSAPDDVWMVGGTSFGAGPQGIVLRYDGSSFSQMQFTGTATPAAEKTLFKVWGSGPNDVMVVGEGGTAVRWDGSSWADTNTRSTDTLFTVHGTESEMYAVGGRSEGVVLRYDGFSWANIAPEATSVQPGVFVAPDGDVWTCGSGGYVAYYRAGRWNEIDTGTFRDFHGMYVGESGAFAAGGLLASVAGPRMGTIGRWGKPE